jgi:arginine deiminase
MDEAGRCYSAGFRHPLYEATFKCNKTITFPCRSDVCHTDEYVTFLKNDTVVTNQQEFVPALKEAGVKNIRLVPYDVHLSLANVLIVNNTVFMMYLDHVKDKMLQAKAVFEREGYKVIPINSGGAGRQYGAVHCLTKEIPE